MSSFTVHLKTTTGGEKISVDVTNEMTIAEVKAAVANKADIPAENQRLIYKGQVLKDDRTVESYGLAADHVLHLVKSRPQGSASEAGQSATQAAGATPSSGAPSIGAVPGNMAGLGSPEMMSQLANSPVMQNLLNDPELLRQMLTTNPVISQLLERNPEFAQVINNPQLLRESMQLAANPALMREQMRNTDRAVSNIESHPEGFNALRRMYENIQEPLLEATANEAANSAVGGNAANPFASLFAGMGAGMLSSTAPATSAAAPATTTVPNTSPLPNPWALNSSQAPAAGTGSNLFMGGGGLPGGLSGVLPGGLSGLGGLGGSAGGADLNSMLQAVQTPEMQQMMQQMASQPQLMEAMMSAAAASNPQLRQMLDADPRLRQSLSDPEVLRQTMNPANLRAILQMEQAMQQLQGSGLMPSVPGLGAAAAGQPPVAAGGGAPGDFSSLLSGLNFGGGAGAFGAPAPAAVSNPEVTFANQLQQLQAMGFYDEQANIQALLATGGNVSAAVDRLLQG